MDEILTNKNIKHICLIAHDKIQYFILSGIGDDNDMVLGYHSLALFNPTELVSSYEEINHKNEITFDCGTGLHSDDLIIIGEDPDIEEATSNYHFSIMGQSKTPYMITDLDRLFSKFMITDLDLHSQYQILWDRGINKDICKQLILTDFDSHIKSEITSVKDIISRFLYLYGNCKTCNLPISVQEIVISKEDSTLILPTLSKETMKYIKGDMIKFGDYKSSFKVYETNQLINILDKYNRNMIHGIMNFFQNL
jgi:hypothetical protein